MVLYNPHKYLVRDENYSNESKKIIDEIEKVFKTDSFISYFSANPIINKLSLILKKNDEDYNKYYKSNIDRYNTIKERVSWDFIEPYTEFELSVKDLFTEAETLLNEKNYNQNNKSKDVISRIEDFLSDYINKTKFIDSSIRNQYHNKLNKVKKNLASGNLIALLLTKSNLDELLFLAKDNSEKYKKYYLKVIKKVEISSSAFEKSKQYFTIKDTKAIAEQFSNIEKIMQSQSYEKFDDVLETLEMIDFKLSDIAEEKKVRISENLRKQIEDLKTSVWLEDWDIINNAVENLLAEADKSGQLYKLNLDKLNVEQRKNSKKEKIFDFIKTVQKANRHDAPKIIEQARYLLDRQASLKDLEALLTKSNKSYQPNVENGKSKSSVKLKKYFIIGSILLSAVIFIYNLNATAEYNDIKGQKYADIISTMVSSYKKSKIEYDIDKIRKRLHISEDQLKIISVDEKEVVVKFKDKIYKKSIRSK